jgi:hypothetical protein
MAKEIKDIGEGSKMLTAVQKMYETFNNIEPDTTIFGLPYFSSDQIKLQLLKAIKIERQQIIKAFNDGYCSGDLELTNDDLEKYYDDTFVKSTWDKRYTK